MPETSKQLHAFAYVGTILAALIMAAAALMYLQSDKEEAPQASQLTLAALSQRIPSHINEALAGDPEGFQRLATDLSRLRSLRGSMSGLPGTGGSWDQLEHGAQKILRRQQTLQAIFGATVVVDQNMPGLLAGAEAFLNESGASTVARQFQQRGSVLQQMLGDLPTHDDPVIGAADIAANLNYMRQVIDALSGVDSEQDVALLDPAARETTLLAMTEGMANIESPVREVLSDIEVLGGHQSDIDAVNIAAHSL